MAKTRRIAFRKKYIVKVAEKDGSFPLYVHVNDGGMLGLVSDRGRAKDYPTKAEAETLVAKAGEVWKGKSITPVNFYKEAAAR